MIVALAEAGTGAIDHFLRGESGRRGGSHPHAPPTTEVLERYLFHRSPGQEPGNGAAVDDLACTQIDAVMDISDAWRDEMCASRWLLILDQQMTAAAGSAFWARLRRPPVVRVV